MNSVIKFCSAPLYQFRLLALFAPPGKVCRFIHLRRLLGGSNPVAFPLTSKWNSCRCRLEEFISEHKFSNCFKTSHSRAARICGVWGSGGRTRACVGVNRQWLPVHRPNRISACTGTRAEPLQTCAASVPRGTATAAPEGVLDAASMNTAPGERRQCEHSAAACRPPQMGSAITTSELRELREWAPFIRSVTKSVSTASAESISYHRCGPN